ncbi:hypothetical protein [Clostridium sp.]|uniref:hypothetical protein n=1 Tax=Clostridium sp. TaxID=1506 RepID=UPI001A60E756|nr:hypothetical protein [Clostridium sp.]MBK5234750.1 hypothetical protein [Clostridium sp.]
MKNIYLKNKILSGLITGGILLSSTSTTFATTANPLTNESKQIVTKIQQRLETSSENLISSNAITQDEADKIKAVINRAKSTTKTNSEKSKTMPEKMANLYMTSNMLNHINPLTSLVDNGTINQTQADKIIMKQLYLYHKLLYDVK